MNLGKYLKRYKRLIAGPVERYLISRYPDDPQNIQLLVLGLPRSGTTLLYQYIVHRLKTSYFMNGSDQWPNAAVLNTFLRYKWFDEYKSTFTNEYGYAPGPNAPHEAGSFWGRFFGFQDYISFDNVSNEHVKTIQKSIATIEQIYGKQPFVNKNVKHLLRIDALARIFPNAFFVIIERDLKDVGLSLLRGRYKNLGRADIWWSARPPEWQRYDEMEPAEQISNQLLGLRRKLYEDIEKISEDRIFWVQYEGFCKEPERLINTISKALKIETRNTGSVKKFEYSENIALTPEEKQLVKYLQND